MRHFHVLWTVRHQLKNIWMRQTYTAGALATGGSSTDLGGSNDSAVSVGTFLVTQTYETHTDWPKSKSFEKYSWMTCPVVYFSIRCYPTKHNRKQLVNYTMEHVLPV
jgi:hypothetical protein